MENLSKYLTSTKQSIRGFAAKCGISPAYCHKLVHGNGNPTVSVANRIEIASNGAVPISSWLSPSHDPALTADDAREVSCPLENVSAADAPFKGAGQ
jgi:hypothetical protein